MRNFVKIIILAIAMNIGATACMKESKSRIYDGNLAVVKDNYFLTDAGIKMIPSNGWKSDWGQSGDRVFITYFYDAYAFDQSSNSFNIELDGIAQVQTESRALPASSSDTVGTANFLLREPDYRTYAWTIPDFLTAEFFFYYSDDKTKSHTFGFVEEEPLYRNDTLFFRLWHKTNETAKSQVVRNFVSLRLNSYGGYLNRSDTTYISLKYIEENVNGGTPVEKRTYAKYFASRTN